MKIIFALMYLNTKCKRHDSWHFVMTFISVSLRRAKQMRKIMYNRAPVILHKKVKPQIFMTA